MTAQKDEALATRTQKQIISLDLDNPCVRSLFLSIEEFLFDWGFAKNITEQLKLLKSMHKSKRYEGQEFHSVYTSVTLQEQFVKDLESSFKSFTKKYLKQEGNGVDATFKAKGTAGDCISFNINEDIASAFFMILSKFYGNFSVQDTLIDQNYLCTAWMEVQENKDPETLDIMNSGFDFCIRLILLYLVWDKFINQHKNLML